MQKFDDHVMSDAENILLKVPLSKNPCLNYNYSECMKCARSELNQISFILHEFS